MDLSSKTQDGIVCSSDGTLYSISKINNRVLRRVLSERFVRERQRFMFSIFGGGHKDHTEHTEEGCNGSYYCHSDHSDHDDFAKHSESTHRESQYSDYSDYSDVYHEVRERH